MHEWQTVTRRFLAILRVWFHMKTVVCNFIWRQLCLAVLSNYKTCVPTRILYVHKRLSPQRIHMKTIVCVWAIHVCPHNESIWRQSCVCVGYARLSPQRIHIKTIVCVWATHVCPHNESIWRQLCVCVGYSRLSPQRILMKTIVCVGYARLSPQRILMNTIVCVGYETPTQYLCCSRERLWVVADLKRRFRNGQNE